MEDVVIVGGGLTAATAAKTLREEGFSGPVRIIGREAFHPYLRPPLSKEYMAGTAERDTVFIEKDEWYTENNVELLLSTGAVGLDTSAHTVKLQDDSELGYGKLLLATGCGPRKLRIPGTELDGVHYLRTLKDSDRLRETLSKGGANVVIIGAGWIGLEIASSATTLGNKVTVLERDPIPLGVILGEELGTYFTEFQRGHGVVIRPSVNVESLKGESGHVTGVVLAGGEVVPADAVVIGVGVIPNTRLAEDGGLELENGILADAALRTSATDVFAAGDVANAMHPIIKQRLRSEHWANALASGAAAAKSMLGQDVSYDAIPYFYTDQFDLGMEYSGYAPLTKGATVVYRGDPASGEFIAFWVANDRVVAGMNVNVWDVNEAVQGIIGRANVVDPARLSDAAVPLDEL